MPSIPPAPHDTIQVGGAAAAKPVDRKVKARPGGGEIPLVTAAGAALPSLTEGQRAVARQSGSDEGGGRLPMVHAGALAVHEGPAVLPTLRAHRRNTCPA